jgi:hypothetical protein
MEITDITILIYSLIGIILVLAILVVRLEFKVKKLLVGKNGKSLEGTILSIKNGILRLDSIHAETKKQIENIESRLRKNIKKAEVVRFNPFQGTGSGGNQSFATALINEDGDGVVFSSLYSRERVSVFAKPIKNYSSEYELSEEERGVIKKAKLS